MYNRKASTACRNGKISDTHCKTFGNDVIGTVKLANNVIINTVKFGSIFRIDSFKFNEEMKTDNAYPENAQTSNNGIAVTK